MMMAVGTREALVDAAAQLMDAGGLEAVTLRNVGHRVGLSHNAPYKHFADKETLLAAVAARELRRQGAALTKIMRMGHRPAAVLREAMRGYVAWAFTYPVRFKLVYGAWSKASPELAEAASSARTLLLQAVTDAQQHGHLPNGDPERLTALLQALAHGAVNLALAGHLSPTGKGRADATDLIDDLLHYLQTSA